MILKNRKLQIAILIYLIIMGAFVFINPKYLENEKLFGIGENRTLFPLWLIIFVVAVMSYYISLLIVNF